MGTKPKHDILPYLEEYMAGDVNIHGEKRDTGVGFPEDCSGYSRLPETLEEAVYAVNTSGPLSITGGGTTKTVSTSSTGGGSWITTYPSNGTTGPWTPGTGTSRPYVTPVPTTIPPTHVVPAVWTDHTYTTDNTHITIHDENGELKRLGIAEVSRYYAEALEYRRIKRFARLFPMVKEMLNELLVAIKLSDPHDEDELDQMEEELREQKKKK